MGLHKWDGTSKMELQNGTSNLVSKEASMGKKHARLCFIPICQRVPEILHFERRGCMLNPISGRGGCFYPPLGFFLNISQTA